MSPATRIDPYLAGNFLVEIDGVTASAFNEVTGLEAAIEVVDYRSGNTPESAVRKLPGLHKFTNITLKRGFTNDLSLWNWFNSVLNGNVVRASMSIVLLDQNENPVLRWNVHEAWPCRWEGPVMAGGSNDIAIETLEICHEGFVLSAG
jgi:phage tail-like protein